MDLENLAARRCLGGAGSHGTLVLTEQAPTYRLLQKGGGLRLRYSHCGARPGDRAYDEQHTSFSVSLVDRGVFSYRNGRGEAVLGPGWLMLGNDGDAYVCSHEVGDGSGDDSLILGWSAETHEALQDALGQMGGPFEQPCLPPLPRVAALLRSLVASGDEGFALEETVLAVVAAIQHETSGVAPAVAPHERDRAAAAARYIESHAGEPLSLADVAGEVGLSPFHFLRSFRRAIGVTPHQYLMRMRLVRAVALLGETTLPVTEIGYEAGWADLSNFTRTFRRDVGCSPREFRRNRTLGGAPRWRRSRRPPLPAL
jgi:AraC family transcriptional regulator